MERRLAAWDALATEVDGSTLDSIVKEITLNDAIPTASALLAGKIAGRVIVKL
jgi:acrylyl-CoA reductase (NADPH)